MASIRKRGNSYTVTAYMGYDERGKQLKRTTTFHPPEGVSAKKAEKLAKQYAATWEADVRGHVDLNENLSFADLAEWYYTTVAPSTLKPNTLCRFRDEIRQHVMPRLGREKLKNITPAMLDKLFIDLQNEGNLERKFLLRPGVGFGGMNYDQLTKAAGVSRSTVYTAAHGQTIRKCSAEKIAAALQRPTEQIFEEVTVKRGLSGSTANKVFANLSAIFTAAVRKEIMLRNPCTLATPPRHDTAPARYLDEEQCRRFLQLLQDFGDPSFATYCNLMLAAGLRPGECAALHWEDVDLPHRELNIRCTIVRIDGHLERQTPKTSRSRRRILLPHYVVTMLEEHRLREADKPNLHGAVFCNQRGDYYDPINLNARLKQVLRGSDLPAIHLHSLRHTHASLLINSNVAARVIADRMGHSSTATTLNIYGHVFAESERKAMRVIETSLFRGNP